MLTTAQLIARLTPTALAEAIVSLEQDAFTCDLCAATVAAMQTELECNIGESEAEVLLIDARP